MEQKRNKTYQLAVTALFAAILCILGPLSLPIGPVPISLATLIVYLAAYILGAKLGTISCAIYLLLGLVGLPVFSGYAGGIGKLAGPTGGYLVGYLPLAFIAGLLVSKGKGKMIPATIGMILGTAVLYLLGTIWFVIQMDYSVGQALAVCVIPFLFGDAIKIVVAVLLGGTVRKRLLQAGFDL